MSTQAANAQAALFSTGAYGQAVPGGDGAAPKATRNEAYRRHAPRLSAQQQLYLYLLRAVAARGQRTSAGDVIYDLTDREAEALLEARGTPLPRSSINGRRDELLCRNHRSVCTRPECAPLHHKASRRSCPHALVRAAGKRRCRVTGKTATAWAPKEATAAGSS